MHPERGRRWVVCANPAAVGKVNHLLLFGRPLKSTPAQPSLPVAVVGRRRSYTREADGFSSCLFGRIRGDRHEDQAGKRSAGFSLPDGGVRRGALRLLHTLTGASRGEECGITLQRTSVEARCYLTQGSIRQGKRLPCTLLRDAQLRFSPSISASRMTEETVAAAGPGSPLLGSGNQQRNHWAAGRSHLPTQHHPLGLYRKLPARPPSMPPPQSPGSDGEESTSPQSTAHCEAALSCSFPSPLSRGTGVVLDRDT